MDISERLRELESQDLKRGLRALPEAGGVINLDGRRIINLSSNDYLGLSSHPELKRAAVEAVEKYGCGATASRLMSGNLDLHEALETELAGFVGAESALVFGSGFLVNLGVLSALAGKDDTVFSDRLNHASLIDGMRLSGANFRRYRHSDMNDLETQLEKYSSGGQSIIVSDSVFSMDGDLAPLAELSGLAKKYNAWLMIDEAHALGVLGGGAGACRAADIRPEVITATMSKSLGGYGGFVACPAEMKEYLVNRARSLIYSTGLPPACLASARAAIKLIEKNPQWGSELLSRAELLRDRLAGYGFDVKESGSQILPVMTGENSLALELARAAWERGVLATAIRPPTVPEGTARVRLSVSLSHSEEDIETAARILAEAASEVGLI